MMGATMVAPKLWRVEVPNVGTSSPTTNAYVVGGAAVVVVDPGSAEGSDALLAALADLGQPPISAIVLTHGHRDHASGAAALRAASGAPVWLHPAELVEATSRGYPLPLDQPLADGQVLEIDDLVFDAVATPGHAAGHIAFVERGSGTTLAGDLVSGHGSIAVFPPYGSMIAYLASLQRLRDRGVGQLLPGHGPILPDGPETLRRYIARRLAREARILDLVRGGKGSIEALLGDLYRDLRPQLRRQATGMIVAHLNKLIDEGRVRRADDGEPARYVAIEREE